MEHRALFSNPAQSFQENAITVFGPRLYNSLPKYLRDSESVKTEKLKFLELISDQPKMRMQLCHRIRKQEHPRPAHSSEGSRNLLEFTKVQHGGVPDSTMEQS